MLSSNNSLLLSTVFTVGFIVGGVIVSLIDVKKKNNKESQQQILIDDIENDQGDDDITVSNCKYYKKHFTKSSFSSPRHHSPSPSISSLHSSLSNFLTSPNPFISIHEFITKLNQLHVHQKNLYKRQQTLQSDTISFNYHYTYLLTETNVFKDYSCLQISKSKEKIDLLQQKIKSLQSSSVNYEYISEINNIMKIQIAEMKWLENFSEMYEEKSENFMKNLNEMKERFNEYKQETLKEINELKERVEGLKCEIGVYGDERTIKEIRGELKIGELSNLLSENGFI